MTNHTAIWILIAGLLVVFPLIIKRKKFRRRKTRAIRLLKNNDNKDWEDLKWVDEFYRFLQGISPDEINDGKRLVKMSQKKAFYIIWYLQEHFPLLPDYIERCDECGELYDSNSQGHHSELTGKFYCSEYCEPHDLYEREQRHEEKQIRLRKLKSKPPKP